jgi:hypothetical protein
MSFKDCILNAEKEGVIDGQESQRLQGLFDDHVERNAAKMPPGAAEAQAARDTFDQISYEAARKKRTKLLQAQTYQQVKQNITEYRTIKGEEDIGQAATALLEQDGVAKYSSVAQRIESVKQLAFSRMDNVLGTFRRNLVGSVRNKAKLQNVVREIFGEGTGDAAAREMAAAWSDAAEYLRKRFNAAGGGIAAREDWGMPQFHDSLELRKAGYEAWRDFILPRLDRDKMIDQSTGLPFDDGGLEIALNDVYQTIITEGMNKLEPSGGGGGRSLANRRMDHRFLSFRNADSWMEYQNKFGNTNAFDTMIAHIDTMSRDIGIVEILGPNPNSTLNFIKQTLRKQAGMQPEQKNRINRQINTMDALYSAVSGSINAPVDSRIAQSFAGLRQVLTSAQLGAATLAAITDFNFVRIAKRMAGLPQTKTISDYLKLMNPLGAEEKGRLAIRMGLIAEGWTSIASAQMRFVGDISGPEITRRLSDVVMRASLLSPHTQANRWAFGMSYAGALADNAALPFSALDENFRKTMQNYGISEADWDVIRATQAYEYEGQRFLTAPDIESRTDIPAARARELSTKVLEMINTETNYAVPSSSLRGRVLLTGDSRPGTLGGEIGRSFAQYKNFGVTLVATHLMRGWNQPTGKMKGHYLADLVISTTLMGALALQLKEMSKGRDPRPMDSTDFWFAAMLQGGGLGIYGDFLFADVNRYGGGLEATVAGPTVGFLDDVRNLTLGNIKEAAAGEDTKFTQEAIKFASRYAPGASIWYMRLALERGITDQLRMWADPNSFADMKRLERYYQREYGQNYWWRPGRVAPSRPPDIGAAVGE